MRMNTNLDSKNSVRKEKIGLEKQPYGQLDFRMLHGEEQFRIITNPAFTESDIY